MGEGHDVPAVSLLCATWNVGAALPDESLAHWLMVTNDSSTMPQIYVIALQEIVELTTFNVVGPNRSSYAWESRIQDVLRDSYTLIANEQRVGLLLLVFAHSSVLPWISTVQSANRAVGVLGIAGNKAGVAVRFRLYDTSMCFVAAHFTAHTGKLVSRNADFHTILNAIHFPDHRDIFKPISIMDNDCVFWMGDLNYRLELPIAQFDEVRQMIADRQFEALLRHDQLLTSMNHGKAFEGFQEGAINFAPTYKYEVGSRPLKYETVAEQGKEVRMPAWCDRVLYSTPTKIIKVTQQSYSRVDMHSSDHVPVMSEFSMHPKILNSVVNFLGGAFFGGIGWEIIPLLHFLVLTTQLCIPLNGLYANTIISALGWTTGGSASGLHSLANRMASLPGASKVNATYNQVTANNLNVTTCEPQVGLPRFACFAGLEAPHLFLVVLFNYLLMLLVIAFLAVLWQVLRWSLHRFHKHWRLYRKREIWWTLLATVLKANSLGMCMLTSYAVFQLMPGNLSALSTLAVALLLFQIGFLGWAAWRGGPKERYTRAMRSANQRMKYGFLYSDFRERFRLFGLLMLFGEFISGCMLGAISPATGTEAVGWVEVKVQLGVLLAIHLLIFCGLMVTQPFVSIQQFWVASLLSLIKVAILGGLLIWMMNSEYKTESDLRTTAILLTVGCGLLVLTWLIWFVGLQLRVYAISCQNYCFASRDFNKKREKQEYEASKAALPALTPEPSERMGLNRHVALEVKQDASMRNPANQDGSGRGGGGGGVGVGGGGRVGGGGSVSLSPSEAVPPMAAASAAVPEQIEMVAVSELLPPPAVAPEPAVVVAPPVADAPALAPQAEDEEEELYG